jgi:predicted N-formylglutamate amidohydrolase
MYKHLFAGNEEVLSTHRGWDLGAPVLLGNLESEFGITPYKSEISRLIVDLNRSPTHKNLYSEFTRDLSKLEKISLLDSYYYPYRDSMEMEIEELIRTKYTVVHIAVHSFTPELNGEIRNAEIGVLYDPSHRNEKKFCSIWKEELKTNLSTLRIRSNYPYYGSADSLPTFLRRKFKDSYLGIELEINQSLFVPTGKKYNPSFNSQAFTEGIIESITKSIDRFSKS